ncbi:MAG TPA: hypothetical protein PKD51_19245, partial [Saprospiraceae bacterium]|nr:hypothetical protein [Saprospiraceae bacterium]
MRVDEPNVNCDQFTSYQSPSCKLIQRFKSGQDFRIKIPIFFYFILFSFTSVNNIYAQPATPAGFVANPSPNAGQVFLACGPNQVGMNDIVYRLFYSPTATAPVDPLTATQYVFGTTAGDGNGTAAFGFNISGLIPGTPYTFWLYQYNSVTMQYSVAPAIAMQNSGVAGPPATPAGFVANPSSGSGEIFLACGPNQVGMNDIVYRLFYSVTASAPSNPQTATQYTFGSTAGDGNGTNAFGFNISGLTPGTPYTFWLYQYNTMTMQYSVTPAIANQTSGGASTPVTSPYCATPVLHFGGDAGSNILLTIKNTGTNSMEVRAVSANADPVDLLIVNGGSGAMISPATNPSAGEYLITLTWAGAPPANVNLNVLWSKVSFGGNWQLSMANVDIPFAATCPAAAPTSAYCETPVLHFGGDPGSNILLTIKNTGTNSMEVRAVSANADPVDLLIVNGGSGAVISTATNPSAGVYLITLTWAGAPPANVNLNVLWSKVSFGGNWQLSMANIDVPFAATCPAAPQPTTPSSNLPNPTCSAADVINIYGGAYPTNIATNYNPNWGQSGFCCVNPNFDPGTGNVVMAYPMFN